LNPREYPSLKQLGKVHISKPSTNKVVIDVDRAEKEQHDPHSQYVDQLNAEIAEYQAEIDARKLLLTDIANT
jgi:hypothetical protein